MKSDAKGISKWATALAFGACALAASSVGAQAWPTKPIRLIVASAPAGNIDLVARVLADKLGPVLGQPIVVDNRAGAGGNLAAELAANAPADGYTLIAVATSHSTNLHLHSKMGYDPIKDFAPIMQLGAAQFAFVVHPSSPDKNLGDFIARSKVKRGDLKYASAGIGQANHLGMELLKHTADVDLLHVPYKAMGPVMTAVMSGEVDIALLSLPAAIPAAKGGKLRILAVTGDKRSSQLPEVPTAAEAGLSGYQITGWQGLLAPAGTPQAIIDRLHQESAKILKQPEVVEKLSAGGMEVVGSTPTQFAAFINAEIAKWKVVIVKSGAKAD